MDRCSLGCWGWQRDHQAQGSATCLLFAVETNPVSTVSWTNRSLLLTPWLHHVSARHVHSVSPSVLSHTHGCSWAEEGYSLFLLCLWVEVHMQHVTMLCCAGTCSHSGSCLSLKCLSGIENAGWPSQRELLTCCRWIDAAVVQDFTGICCHMS